MSSERECDDERTSNHPVQEIMKLIVEGIIRNVAHKVADRLAIQLPEEGKPFSAASLWLQPNPAMPRAIMFLAWASATGSLAARYQPDELHAAALRGKLPEPEDITVTREALQLLTLALPMNPAAFEELLSDELWSWFVIDLLLLARNRLVFFFFFEV